jgi:hypothetical protein
MKNILSRQNFLRALASAGITFMFNKTSGRTSISFDSKKHFTFEKESIHKYFPSQDPELVMEFVLASHGQFDKVKNMLLDHPELAKSSWDWGFGDWETALGAASHTGNKQIADLLIEYGARPDIFTYTMLGNLNAVKAIIEAIPGIQKINGPHNISLLTHAKIRLASKNINSEHLKTAQAMVDYLSSLDNEDNNPKEVEISEEEKKHFIGKYRFGENTDNVFLVDTNKNGSLTIRVQSQKFERFLVRTKENSFYPTGASHVEIAFDLKDGLATQLTYKDPAPIVIAIRE